MRAESLRVLGGSVCTQRHQSFTEHLVQANGLDKHGFCSWELSPGMRFGEEAFWWGEKGTRPGPHEGIDLCSYLDTAGHCRFLESGAMIPPLFHGTVVDIFPDFLGQSLLFAHDQMNDGWQLYSVIAHVVVEPGVALGQRYSDRSIVARVAPLKRPGVPTHLHISTLAISELPPRPLSWPVIVRSEMICFLDPFLYIGGLNHNLLVLPE